MTSTSFNVGLTDSSRLSSRVLRPPGGGHTDIFGGEPEPPRGRRQFPAANAGACFICAAKSAVCETIISQKKVIERVRENDRREVYSC